MFENKKTHNGIYYSRYIASWRNVGGKIYREGLFEQWLREVQKLTDEEICDIMLMAENGKIELEGSADRFLDEHIQQNNWELELANEVGIVEGCNLKGRLFQLKTEKLINKGEFKTMDELPGNRCLTFKGR